MKLGRAAAIVFTIVTAIVICFQIALALGAPWGAYAMGGASPGVYPPPMRVAAVVQAALLITFALVVLARSGLAVQRWSHASEWLVWLVVAFSAVSFVMNLITPSAGERAIWAPVAALMLVCSLTVAIAARKNPGA